jgi:hypothetical protein
MRCRCLGYVERERRGDGGSEGRVGGKRAERRRELRVDVAGEGGGRG